MKPSDGQNLSGSDMQILTDEVVGVGADNNPTVSASEGTSEGKNSITAEKSTTKLVAEVSSPPPVRVSASPSPSTTSTPEPAPEPAPAPAPASSSSSSSPSLLSGSAALLPSQSSTTVGPQIDDRKLYEIVIKYEPYAAMVKWMKYRFSSWSSFKAWFALSLVVIFFTFRGPDYVVALITYFFNHSSSAAGAAGVLTSADGSSNFAVYSGFFWFLSLIGLGAFAVFLLNPTNVRFNKSGISLEWNRLNLNFRKSLAWHNVEKIEVFYPAGKTAQQDCVIRFKDISKIRDIDLKFGAIPTVEERDKLQRAINTWGDDIGRDPHLLEMLTPAQDNSYTELWMQALSAPPKRERLTPLPMQAALQEGRFVVLEQLGVGGQGTAYLAREADDKGFVVLKEFILPVYVDVNVRRQALERMQNEAAMLRRLDNPRVVRLIDFFIEDHRGYLVLECIDGYSLRKIIQENGCMKEPQVRELASQMCATLTYLHSLTPPVVHRDFTPDNLILGSDGILKLVDFNVAQQTESTATGTVVGKHAYLPPEQFRGRPSTQSDIYAMGATLYYMLTGEDPEPITASQPSSKDKDVSAGLNDIIHKATLLDTKKRYQKIEELHDDLKNLK
jgi:tRNA A-37 threonylcarbamoyl transferase component Bud32